MDPTRLSRLFSVDFRVGVLFCCGNAGDLGFDFSSKSGNVDRRVFIYERRVLFLGAADCREVWFAKRRGERGGFDDVWVRFTVGIRV